MSRTARKREIRTICEMLRLAGSAVNAGFYIWCDHGQLPGQTSAGQRKVPQDNDTVEQSRGNRKQGIEPRTDARGESRRACEAMTVHDLLPGSQGVSLIPATISFGKYVDSISTVVLVLWKSVLKWVFRCTGRELSLCVCLLSTRGGAH